MIGLLLIITGIVMLFRYKKVRRKVKAKMWAAKVLHQVEESCKKDYKDFTIK